MDEIGEFTINALNKMCAECKSPQLELDTCVHESFNCEDVFTYHLYCKNYQQCEYAFKVGKRCPESR